MKATCTRCGFRITSKRSRNACTSCGGRLDYPQPSTFADVEQSLRELDPAWQHRYQETP